MKTFKALDTKTGCTVENLIYATLIPVQKIDQAKLWLQLIKSDQPEAQLQLRKAGTLKVIYSI
ncbi:MAG: hypothetical protein WCH59_09205 [Chitinophagia bacterium]|jgi:hypothetical protein